MARRIINWGSDEEFIKIYNELKSSRKVGEYYGCDKSSVLNHAKAIEYDGEQHYKKDNIFDYEYTHRHDEIKNQWCRENNVPLIRIPYDLCLEDLLLETSNFIKK